MNPKEDIKWWLDLLQDNIITEKDFHYNLSTIQVKGTVNLCDYRFLGTDYANRELITIE